MKPFHSIEKYNLNGRSCEIKNGSGFMGGYNGYITYPQRPLKESGYDGIARYIPVHGGLTYASQNEDGTFTYGFDSSHSDSDEYPNKDIDWIKKQIQIINNGIELCKELEDEYLLAEGNNEKRVKICQKVLEIENDSKSYSFGVCIKLLGGSL